MHLAAAAAVVLALPAAGASLDLSGNLRRSALMHASAAGQAQATRTLVEAGADLDLRDVDGKTATDLARDRSHDEVVEFLDAQDKGGFLSRF